MTAAFADCLHVPCPNCGAEQNDWCHFTVNGKVYRHHAPCTARLRAADKAAT